MDFNAQNTDAENSKPCPNAVSRDNDLKVSSAGSAQEIARDTSNQNTVAGSGGEAVTAGIK